jgi:hypothetical protein
MSTHPLSRQIDGQSPISRSGFSGDVERYTCPVYRTAAEVQSDDLSECTALMLSPGDGTSDKIFRYDSTSSASHDGSSVIVDSGGRRFIWNGRRDVVVLTQAAYDALTPDANTIYLITAD